LDPVELECDGMIIRWLTKTAQQQAWSSRMCVAIICLAVFAAFCIGVRRDFPTTVGAGNWGRFAFAIGAALTEMRHGGYGYVTALVMDDVLHSEGLTTDPAFLEPLKLRAPDNFRNPTVINAAIRKAAEFKWPFNPDNVDEVRGASNDDLGFVDYVKMSFRLFGINIISLYLSYFVLLGVSIGTFVASFRRETAPLVVLAVVALAHAALFVSGFFDPALVETVADPRYLSTLAIIPALHVGLFVTQGQRLSAANVLGIVIQSAIIAFSLLIRATVVWVLVALTLLSLGTLFAAWRRGEAGRLRRLWPMAILGFVLIIQAWHVQASLHPRYEAKGELSRHVIWHTIFVELANHPDWPVKYAEQFQNAIGDELPPTAARLYLIRHPPDRPEEVYQSADRQSLKSAAAETYVRKAFFEFFVNDPRYVIETFMLYNPRLLYEGLAKLLLSLDRDLTYAMPVVVIFICLALLIAGDPRQLRLAVFAILLLPIYFVVSLLPLALSLPAMMAMADQFYMLLATAGGMFVLLLSFLFRMVFTRGRDPYLAWLVGIPRRAEQNDGTRAMRPQQLEPSVRLSPGAKLVTEVFETVDDELIVGPSTLPKPLV
jgi:hypothetical protein